VPNDWPDISKKPIDHPFGPYADTFSVQQHKFGPWKPIEALQKNAENKSAQKITKNTSS
jgi:thiosulfate dehydrogenase